MHKVTAQAGGIKWAIGTYANLDDAMDAHEKTLLHYQQACRAVRRHPPITVRVINPSGRVLHTRTASRPSRAERGPDMIPVVAAGIPALAKVMYSSPGRPAYRPMANMRGEPEEMAEVEVALYDRKGYPAGWLVHKLSDAEWFDVQGQALAHLQRLTRPESCPML